MTPGSWFDTLMGSCQHVTHHSAAALVFKKLGSSKGSAVCSSLQSLVRHEMALVPRGERGDIGVLVRVSSPQGGLQGLGMRDGACTWTSWPAHRGTWRQTVQEAHQQERCWLTCWAAPVPRAPQQEELSVGQRWAAGRTIAA